MGNIGKYIFIEYIHGRISSAAADAQRMVIGRSLFRGVARSLGVRVSGAIRYKLLISTYK